MRHRLLPPVNIALFVICGLAIGHVIYRWDQLRPRVVFSAPIECGDVPDFDADYFTTVCQAVINALGPLPADPAQAGRVIADNAEKLGLTWPNNFKVNTAGEICNCAGEPYQIQVSADRVAVTSESLYAFYFAELNQRPPQKTEQ
jgi:hypothetical protein